MAIARSACLSQEQITLNPANCEVLAWGSPPCCMIWQVLHLPEAVDQVQQHCNEVAGEQSKQPYPQDVSCHPKTAGHRSVVDAPQVAHCPGRGVGLQRMRRVASAIHYTARTRSRPYHCHAERSQLFLSVLKAVCEVHWQSGCCRAKREDSTSSAGNAVPRDP